MTVCREQIRSINASRADRRNVVNAGIDMSVAYITVKGLANMAGVPVSTIEGAVKRGKVKAIHRGARYPVLIHPEDAKAYILSREKKQC